MKKKLFENASKRVSGGCFDPAFSVYPKNKVSRFE